MPKNKKSRGFYVTFLICESKHKIDLFNRIHKYESNFQTLRDSTRLVRFNMLLLLFDFPNRSILSNKSEQYFVGTSLRYDPHRGIYSDRNGFQNFFWNHMDEPVVISVVRREMIRFFYDVDFWRYMLVDAEFPHCVGIIDDGTGLAILSVPDGFSVTIMFQVGWETSKVELGIVRHENNLSFVDTQLFS